MILNKIKFKANKKEYNADIAVPENLQDAIGNMEYELIFNCFMDGYLRYMKKKIVGDTSRIVKLDLSRLNADQIEGLELLEIIPSAQKETNVQSVERPQSHHEAEAPLPPEADQLSDRAEHTLERTSL